MTKLKGLLLTEGMHGMISQVEGLAKALGLDFIHEKIELNNFWKMIPPKITPIKRFVFKNDILQKFDVVISCGRKSVIPSIFLKKKFGNKIMSIHIQDPKVSSNNFDFEEKNQLEQSFDLIATCVDKIYNEEEVWAASDCTKKEIKDFLEQMNSNQFQSIESFFSTMPKLTHSLTFENPKTKKENTVVLEGLASFFA